MLNNKEFIQRLDQIMKYYDLTATALAEKIDFNRSSISHLISGRNNPSLEFVIKILENFPEVNWKWLIHGKGDFPNTIDGLKNPSAIPPKMPQLPDLFSQDVPQSTGEVSNDNSSIERIVVFYRNDTFKSYQSS